MIIVSKVLVVSMILLTPDVVFIRNLAAHAFEVVILLLMSAMFFMIVRMPRIMYVSLGLCAILSFYLRRQSNTALRVLFNRNQHDFSLCQLTIQGSSDQYENFTKAILQSKADIINIQEVTPDWSIVLKDALIKEYPYTAELNRIDPYGMVIFSKYPIHKIDTIVYEDTVNKYQVPALRLRTSIDHRDVDIVGCHVLPRINHNDFDKVQGFIEMLAHWASHHQNQSTMIIGDFSLTPWDYDIQKLINESKLNLSRREPHLFVQPFEHILYSNDIECNQLKELLSPNRNHIGIEGFYRFKY